ncbi:hypothetical protein [Butyrivibrio sp. WCD2001]|uniref:hypothetical protein n=1 Tax=Butyrivibrio sp. WCD2001 TaxID=1280681 RepID=UPI0003F84507|nr:hypothetical protein [Butyrivibrio sp. WCD2001]
MSKIAKKSGIFFIIFITVFRVWLAQIQNIDVAIRGGGADDWHQIKQAIALSSGKWLGKFDYHTYIKEIGYPLFCFILNKLHISYGVGCGLLIIAVSALCAAALRPLFSNKFSNIVYLFLLFNPAGFGTLKLYRAALLGLIPLAVIACVLGIYLYSCNGKYIYSLIFGFAGFIYTAWFWILKEDAIWLLPFLICASAVCFCRELYLLIKKNSSIKAFILVTCALLLAFIGAYTSTTFVSKMNANHYGIALTNDRSKGEFARLCGMLYRIDSSDADEDQDTWFSKGAFHAAVEASPHLASLNGLEEEFVDWGNRGASNFSGWPRGDMFTWALRESMKDNGCYESEQTAQEFCRAAAAELEEAFDTGILHKKNRIYLTGYIRGYKFSELVEDAVIAIKTIGRFSIYKNVKVSDSVFYADGDMNKIGAIENLFKVNMPLTDEQLVEFGIDSSIYKMTNNNIVRERYLFITIATLIYKIYRFAMILLIPVSLSGFVLIIFKTIKEKNIVSGRILLITIALLLTAFCAVYITALFGTWLSAEPAGSAFVAYCPVAYFIMDIVKLLLCGYVFNFLLNKTPEIKNQPASS